MKTFLLESLTSLEKESTIISWIGRYSSDIDEDNEESQYKSDGEFPTKVVTKDSYFEIVEIVWL